MWVMTEFFLYNSGLGGVRFCYNVTPGRKRVKSGQL